MRSKLASIFALAFLLALAIGCGGGGGGGGSSGDTPPDCSPVGGDSNLPSRWTFDVGVHPIEEITFNANGTFSGILTSSCQVGGTWRASGGVLTLCIASATPTCVSHDIASGDVGVFGYSLSTDGNTLTVADGDGSTDLERD